MPERARLRGGKRQEARGKEKSNSNNNNIDNDERVKGRNKQWDRLLFAPLFSFLAATLYQAAEKDEGQCIVFNRHRWQPKTAEKKGES